MSMSAKKTFVSAYPDDPRILKGFHMKWGRLSRVYRFCFGCNEM